MLTHPPRRDTVKDTHINVVNVENPGVELQTHGFGLLDWVSQLTVSLNKAVKFCYMFEFVLFKFCLNFLLRENHQKIRIKVGFS